MISIKQYALIAAAAVCGFSQISNAAVAWTMPSGSNGVVNYSDGESDNGYFGDPTIIGSTFSFTPHNFSASASGVNSSQTTSDRVSFEFSGTDNQDIQSVSIHAFGDWSILGAGGMVQEAGHLFIKSLSGATAGQVYDDYAHVLYTPDGGTPTTVLPVGTGSGSFDGTLTVNLPAGFKSVQFVLNDILQAVTPATGGTAFIQKKGEGGPSSGDPQIVFSAVLPEPTSMAVLFLGGLGLIRRRRTVAQA